jgi:hypothetical protein
MFFLHRIFVFLLKNFRLSMNWDGTRIVFFPTIEGRLLAENVWNLWNGQIAKAGGKVMMATFKLKLESRN